MSDTLYSPPIYRFANHVLNLSSHGPEI